MRLIDADHFLKTLNSVAEKNSSELWKKMAKTMTFMVETECIFSEVSQPKRGQWIEHPHGFWTRLNSGGERDGWLPDYECSVCGSRAWKDVTAYRYCPNCGARMRGEKANENNI